MSAVRWTAHHLTGIVAPEVGREFILPSTNSRKWQSKLEQLVGRLSTEEWGQEAIDRLVPALQEISLRESIRAMDARAEAASLLAEANERDELAGQLDAIVASLRSKKTVEKPRAALAAVLELSLDERWASVFEDHYERLYWAGQIAGVSYEPIGIVVIVGHLTDLVGPNLERMSLKRSGHGKLSISKVLETVWRDPEVRDAALVKTR